MPNAAALSLQRITACSVECSSRVRSLRFTSRENTRSQSALHAVSVGFPGLSGSARGPKVQKAWSLDSDPRGQFGPYRQPCWAAQVQQGNSTHCTARHHAAVRCPWQGETTPRS